MQNRQLGRRLPITKSRDTPIQTPKDFLVVNNLTNFTRPYKAATHQLLLLRAVPSTDP